MFPKTLALALDKPLLAVNHMRAHILAHFLRDPKPEFPFLCLTVSGGHTQLVVVKSALEMEVIGQTIDDAAGEAVTVGGDPFGATRGGTRIVVVATAAASATQPRARAGSRRGVGRSRAV